MLYGLLVTHRAVDEVLAQTADDETGYLGAEAWVPLDLARVLAAISAEA